MGETDASLFYNKIAITIVPASPSNPINLWMYIQMPVLVLPFFKDNWHFSAMKAAKGCQEGKVGLTDSNLELWWNFDVWTEVHLANCQTSARRNISSDFSFWQRPLNVKFLNYKRDKYIWHFVTFVFVFVFATRDPPWPHIAPLGSHRTVLNSQIYRWIGLDWIGYILDHY